MKNQMDWDFFFRQLTAGMNIDETCFYFSDDPNEEEHYLGYLPQYDKPYWVGYCDVDGGCEFDTAEELETYIKQHGLEYEEQKQLTLF